MARKVSLTISEKTGRFCSVDDEKEKKTEKDMKLIELTRAWGLAEAEVIKSFLESNGIACAFRHDMVQSIYPISVDGLGEIKILVSESDHPVAKRLLEEKPPAEEP